MRSVLLIISVPDSANSSTSGCSSPPGRAPGAAVERVADAALPGGPGEHARPARTLVGIGVPSKYLTLSAAFRERLGGDVVARQAADAAADEVDEHDRVPAAVHAGGEGERRRARRRTR